MTSPLSSDALSVVATNDAQMVTEYMPTNGSALVINLGTSRVYLGTSSSVSPNNGVPLDPGTALHWEGRTNQQQLWVILAPGGTPSTVTVSTLAGDWTPSPGAIAAAAAAALLAQGVPSVLTGAPVAAANVGASAFDVSGYATVFVSFLAGTPQVVAVPPPAAIPEPCSMRVQMGNVARQNPSAPFPLTGQWLYDKTFSMNTSKPGTFVFAPIEGQLLMALPVRGPQMLITGIKATGTSSPTTASSVTVYGTNRAIADDTVMNARPGYEVSATVLANTSTPLLDLYNASNDYIVAKGGPATVYLQAAPAATIILQATWVDNTGTIRQNRLAVFTGANQTQQVILPAGLVALSGFSTVAGTLTFDITPNT